MSNSNDKTSIFFNHYLPNNKINGIKSFRSIVYRAVVLAAICIMLFSCFFAVSASTLNTSQLDNKIVGYWFLETAEIDGEDTDMTGSGIVFKFLADGTFVQYTDYQVKNTGTWISTSLTSIRATNTDGQKTDFEDIRFNAGADEFTANVSNASGYGSMTFSKGNNANSNSTVQDDEDIIESEYTIYTSDRDLNAILPREWNEYTYIYADGSIGDPKENEIILYADGTLDKNYNETKYTGQWLVKDRILTMDYDGNYRNFNMKIYIEYNTDMQAYLLYYCQSSGNKYVLISPIKQGTQPVQSVPTQDTVFTTSSDITGILPREWKEYTYIYANGDIGKPAPYTIILEADGTGQSNYEGVTKQEKWTYINGTLALENSEYSWGWDIYIEYSLALDAYIMYMGIGEYGSGEYFVMISPIDQGVVVAVNETNLVGVPTQDMIYTNDNDINIRLIRQWYNYTYLWADGSTSLAPTYTIFLRDDGTIDILEGSGWQVNRWEFNNGTLTFTGGYTNINMPAFIRYSVSLGAYLLFIELALDESPGDYLVMMSSPTAEELALTNDTIEIQTDTTEQSTEFAAPPVLVDTVDMLDDSYLDGYSAQDAELVRRMIGNWSYYQYIDTTGQSFDADYNSTSKVYSDGTFRDFEGDTFYTGTWKVKNGIITFYYSHGETLKFALDIQYSSTEGKDIMYLKKLNGDYAGDIAVYIREE